MTLNPIGTVQNNNLIQQQGLYANESFVKGETLLTFSAIEILSVPNYLTIQINDDQHITLAPTYIEYINHSCSPNVFFNTTNFTLEALNDITQGDEITFFYPSTEWKMDQAFICSCGNSNCLKEIQGAYYMNNEVLQKYKLTNFIQSKLMQRQIKKTA
jgi:hypothetical protein